MIILLNCFKIFSDKDYWVLINLTEDANIWLNIFNVILQVCFVRNL